MEQSEWVNIPLDITTSANIYQTGVLTKADCMEAGEEHQWPNVLRNKTFTLDYGFYMTLGLGTDKREAGMAHKTGREAERTFFEEKKLWNNEFKDHSGTDKLISALIETLSSMIKARYIVTREFRELN